MNFFTHLFDTLRTDSKIQGLNRDNAKNEDLLNSQFPIVAKAFYWESVRYWAKTPTACRSNMGIEKVVPSLECHQKTSGSQA